MFCVATACKNKNTYSESDEKIADESIEEELYRPNFHFTPKENWINDPNGMFFYNGYYHLYFQYHPEGNKWGPMHWGHAISTDMITWREQPIALYPDELGYIFSGSAVVDVNNTSGFGKDGQSPVVAIYTSHDPQKAKNERIDVETQSIAYSLDEGLTWNKYEGNPVIKNPNLRDFRDPKVIWDVDNNQWVLTLAAGQKTMFYTSNNLKEWSLASEFGDGLGNHEGVWECPDLFSMQVEDSDEIKWVHIVSIGSGGPNGGSATQYFVGDFDGKEFTVDPKFAMAMNKEHGFWVDFGKDNYAGVTWSNIPDSDGRRLFIGWMSNWQYANDVPTETWRGSMTIARELKLTKDDTYRLKVLPVQETQNYRTVKFKNENVQVVNSTKLIDSKNIDLTRSEVNLEINHAKRKSFSLILKNNKNERLLFGYDASKKAFYIERGQSGKVGFSEDFGNKASWAPRISEEENLTLKILLDKTSIELFFDEGRTVMTEIFFPSEPFNSLTIETENQDLMLDSIEIHELKIN
ncbi:MAG: glycoside hydrolase family 32 protein [Maribacter sp.]|nr:glycoside hydrolase family 32 protein [Maribacter sp.]